ncbi:hypothetical protein N8774_01480 [Gammaproteobacteria bacterium]|nr:hypothetical protein [Gammaproteobacteria bacterium]
MRILIALFLSIGLFADNEIYIDQTGNNASIDLEQLGSTNIIGGDDAVAGSMTKAILNGTTMVLDINQIGSSNKFLTDGILGDNFTGFFEFDGDSNEWDFSMDTTGLNTADGNNINIDVTGSLNIADIDIAEDDAANYLDIDWIIDGDSNEATVDIDVDYATMYMDILGDSNDLTFIQSGYGASSSDAKYFYLDLEGSNNTAVIKQQSTLAADWLKIESNASNSNICVIQNDGGSTTSC